MFVIFPHSSGWRLCINLLFVPFCEDCLHLASGQCTKIYRQQQQQQHEPYNITTCTGTKHSCIIFKPHGNVGICSTCTYKYTFPTACVVAQSVRTWPKKHRCLWHLGYESDLCAPLGVTCVGRIWSVWEGDEWTAREKEREHACALL